MNKPINLVNPKDQRMGPNCGVTSVAIATGITFNRSWNLHKKIGNYNNNWKGSTHDHERKAVLQKLKIKYECYDYYTKLYINGVYKENDNIPFDIFPITLQNYVKWNCDMISTYIISTTRHTQVVKNGWAIDQVGAKPICDFWGKNKKVKSVIKILSKDSKNQGTITSKTYLQALSDDLTGFCYKNPGFLVFW